MAITEDDRLLFCPVYPTTVQGEVKDAFHADDLDLAGALRLRPVGGTPPAEYTCAALLVRDAYDDGPWDRFCQPPRPDAAPAVTE